MKKLIIITLALLMIMTTVTLAEMNVPFSEWLDAFGASAEQAVIQDESIVAEGDPLFTVPFTPIGVGSRGDDVVLLQEKLIEIGVLAGKADGIFGTGTEKALIAVQKALGWEDTGVIASADELDTIMCIEPGDGVNLAVGTSDEWSEWMTPEYNVSNKRFIVSVACLDDKKVGDYYTCQVEIEFADVTATQGVEDAHFRFIANGTVDDSWGELGESNVWKYLVNLNEPPVNGVYSFTATRKISETNVNATVFELGFLCENWAGGQFRVRCVKVERGINATQWSAAKEDIGDGFNLALGTSSEWSEWMTPEYNTNSRFEVAMAHLDEKKAGDAYTCQVEIEFADVTPTQGTEDAHFRFVANGKVDDLWGELGESNVWKYLVDLSVPPTNGVYKYVATKVINTINANATDFELGFLCENWASGRFRVRCVKVEKGAHATDWTPAS